MAATQTVQLSSAHAAAVRAAVERLQAERYIARLWDRDASLWATDAATQASIRARLGWLTIAGVMSRQAEALRGFAQEIREAGLTRACALAPDSAQLRFERLNVITLRGRYINPGASSFMALVRDVAEVRHRSARSRKLAG